MTFLERMRSDVGDGDAVWKYLLAKLGHTALIAWVLVCVSGLNAERVTRLSLLTAGMVAALGYLIVGKLLWLRSTTEPVSFSVELRDCAFDGVLGLGVVVLAVIPVYGWRVFAAAAAVWAVLLLAGSNNGWGRPS